MLAILEGCAIMIPVMRKKNDSEFHPFMKISAERKSQMPEWKSIPENERPTWEQFKRGLKVKVILFQED